MFFLCNYWILSFYTFSDCIRPQVPASGHFECSSNSYSQDSVCNLVCDPGFVPATKTSMQCQESSNGFDWSVPFSEFNCVKPCHLVVGGMNKDVRQVVVPLSYLKFHFFHYKMFKLRVQVKVLSNLEFLNLCVTKCCLEIQV